LSSGWGQKEGLPKALQMFVLEGMYFICHFLFFKETGSSKENWGFMKNCQDFYVSSDDNLDDWRSLQGSLFLLICKGLGDPIFGPQIPTAI
jgi:hypothetical protein